ncbi:hypothetical protein PCANC_27177, partial [Puccinia coronata f. sp. avenae]
QPFWADRVTKLGAGMRVDTLTTQCLAEAFSKATGERIMKEKASLVGEKIRAEDGPTRAVNFIYQYLDFALERTQHRVARTSRKKRWVSATSAGPCTLPPRANSADSQHGDHPLDSPTMKKASLPPSHHDAEDAPREPTAAVSSSSSQPSPALLAGNSQSSPVAQGPSSASFPENRDEHEHNTVDRKKSFSTSNLIKIPATFSPGKSWSKLKKVFLHSKVIPNVG